MKRSEFVSLALELGGPNHLDAAAKLVESGLTAWVADVGLGFQAATEAEEAEDAETDTPGAPPKRRWRVAVEEDRVHFLREQCMQGNWRQTRNSFSIDIPNLEEDVV